jgi:hypothetical protein
MSGETNAQGSNAGNGNAEGQGAAAQSQNAASLNTPNDGGATQRSVSDIPSLLKKYAGEKAGNVQKAYFDRNNPNHQQAVDAVSEMYQRESGEAAPSADHPFAGFTLGQGFSKEDTEVVVGVARADNIAPDAVTRAVSAFREADKVIRANGDRSFHGALARLWGADVDRRVGIINDFLKTSPALNRWVKASEFGNDPRLAVALWAHVSHGRNETNRLQDLRRQWSEAKRVGDYAAMDRLEEEMTAGFTKLYSQQA